MHPYIHAPVYISLPCFILHRVLCFGSVPGFALITAPVLTFLFTGRYATITMNNVKVEITQCCFSRSYCSVQYDRLSQQQLSFLLQYFNSLQNEHYHTVPTVSYTDIWQFHVLPYWLILIKYVYRDFCFKIIFLRNSFSFLLPCGPTDADRRRLSVFIGKQKVPRWTPNLSDDGFRSTLRQFCRINADERRFHSR